MKTRVLAALLLLGGAGVCAAQDSVSATLRAVSEWKLHQSIERFLGCPYVWGATGDKSFDCSGFVWRVALDYGVYFKRTSARKLFFSTRPAKPGERGRLGNLLFFEDLKHVGIVNDANSFYHAQSSKGTNLSELSPFWKPKVSGEHVFMDWASTPKID